MTDDCRVELVRITGRVQGVGFRVWTRGEAQKLGLTGWVCNESDGSVEVLIAGSDTAVNAMLKRFWNGPPGASVASVEAESTTLEEMPSGFRITK